MIKQQPKPDIGEWHKDIQKFGNPENGYLDSGFWSFLGYVKTKDSHANDNPVRHLMADKPDYLIVVFLYLLACPVLAIPKSRQMRMSWAMTAFALWHTMQSKYRETLVQLQKESDAHAMVTFGSKNPCAGRMDFVLQNLPGWLRDPNVYSGVGNNAGKLSLATEEMTEEGIAIPWRGSYIQALPGGADQVRSKTPSLYISDEAAYQEAFREAVDALRPAVTGGGRFVALSSVQAGSHFNNMVLESPNGEKQEQQIHPAVEIALHALGMEWPKGMKTWLTPSGVWALEVHYTADPAKDPERDGFEWYLEAVKGYVGGIDSVGWKTEMEIDYGAGGGEPVFPFLQAHNTPIIIPWIDPEKAINEMDIYGGYDYGSTNPSSFQVWGCKPNKTWYALWELHEPCVILGEHVKKMKECPYWEHIKYIVADPAIMNEDQQTADGLKSMAEQFENHGVNFRRGRRGSDLPVAKMFLSEYWDDPMNPKAFLTAGVPNLIAECQGLRYEKHSSAGVELRKNAPEKIKDKDNHGWDASSYLHNALPAVRLAPTKKKSNGYTFNDFLKEHEARTYGSGSSAGIIVN